MGTFLFDRKRVFGRFGENPGSMVNLWYIGKWVLVFDKKGM